MGKQMSGTTICELTDGLPRNNKRESDAAGKLNIHDASPSSPSGGIITHNWSIIKFY